MIDVGSEIGPALSFAKEPAELNLLKLKPRKMLKPKWDKPVPHTIWNRFKHTIKRILISPFQLRQTGESLIDSEMIRWVYLQGGVIEAIGCYGAYLITFAMRGVPLNLLWRSTEILFTPSSASIMLTNGQIANASEQVLIRKEAESSYYLSIIIGQLFNLFVTKSRYRYPSLKSLKWYCFTWYDFLLITMLL